MPHKENLNVNAFMERIKADHSLSNSEKTSELNRIIKPFYESFVNVIIEDINSKLSKEIGESSPQFIVITNISSKQNDSSYFIQISYKNPDIDYNPLTNPFLLLEFSLDGKVLFVISSFKSIEKINEFDNIFNTRKSDLEDKFIMSLEKFLDKI